jgi:hypothetical protein
MIAVRSLEMDLSLEGEQGIVLRVGHEVYVTPLAAVTAAGTAARDVRLATERHDTITTVASLDVDLGLIEEHARHP